MPPDVDEIFNQIRVFLNFESRFHNFRPRVTVLALKFTVNWLVCPQSSAIKPDLLRLWSAVDLGCLAAGSEPATKVRVLVAVLMTAEVVLFKERRSHF